MDDPTTPPPGDRRARPLASVPSGRRIAVEAVAVLFAVLAGGFAGEARSQDAAAAPLMFEISPLVEEIACRPGKTEPFTFTVLCHGAPVAFRVEAVRMTQDEEGLMAPDVVADDPALKLLTPGRMSLRPGEETTIRGRVTAPLTAGAFVPAGILVTQIADDGPTPGPDRGARVGARFVSRYLLRVEVRTFGGVARPRTLQIPAASVAREEDQVVVRTTVANPTEDAIEFGLRAVIRRDGVVFGRAIPLAMPVRRSDPLPRRHEARVLGGSRVRMEGVVERGLPPGAYDLELTIGWAGRDFETVTTPFVIEAPPERAGLPSVLLDGVYLSTRHLLLGTEAGRPRIGGLTLENRRAEEVVIRLEPGADWLLVRPTSLVLPPRQSRGVMVAVVGAPVERPEYAALAVEASATVEGRTVRDRAEAVVGRVPRVVDPPTVRPGPLRYDASAERLILPLVNAGLVHAAPTVDLRLTRDGRPTLAWETREAAWLLPGATGDLTRTATLEPGRYLYEGTLDDAEHGGGVPVAGELIVH